MLSTLLKDLKQQSRDIPRKVLTFPARGLLGVLLLILCTGLSATKPTVNINAPSVPSQNSFELNQYSHRGDLRKQSY